MGVSCRKDVRIAIGIHVETIMETKERDSNRVIGKDDNRDSFTGTFSSVGVVALSDHNVEPRIGF